MHGDQTSNHLAFSQSNRCHVRPGAGSDNPKFRCVMGEIRNFGAPDFVLAGETIDIRAGTPDPASFDDSRSLSGLSQMPSQIFPALAASDDEILVALDAHFAILLAITRE
jgi:hypothetical protein